MHVKSSQGRLEIHILSRKDRGKCALVCLSTEHLPKVISLHRQTGYQSKFSTQRSEDTVRGIGQGTGGGAP